ncbi:MAG: RsmE family RNA methyltransferase [candidate division Zixibacteria bacterium]
MNLLILQESDAIEPGLYRLTDVRGEHIRSVLKLSVGDKLLVGLVGRGSGEGSVTRIDKGCVELTVEALIPVTEIRPVVDIICALPRPQTVKKLLFIAGMTGVRRLNFIRANRVEKSYFHSPLLTEERWTKHLLEGMSQGKMVRLPSVSIHSKFLPFLHDELPGMEQVESDKPVKLLAHPEAGKNLSSVAGQLDSRYIVAIGPEGGFVDFEVTEFEKSGFACFTLGRHLLRVEHALTGFLAQLELLQSDGNS